MKNRVSPYFRNLIVRNVDSQRLFDFFLISAVSSLLLIRTFLYVTGYPQLGGGRIHIAHMLWGGSIMIFALLLQFFFLSRSSRTISAILGGIGFGIFIDEIGKFVTRDYNYLFRPTIAIIYIVFVLLYIAVHLIEKKRGDLTEKEYLINGLEMMKEMVLGDMDKQEQKKALDFLGKNSEHNTLTGSLIRIVRQIKPVSTSQQFFWNTLRTQVISSYHLLLKTSWFVWSVVIFFVIKTIVSLVSSIVLLSQVSDGVKLELISTGVTLSNILSSIFVIVGILLIRRSRVRMLHMFRLSILVTILILQPLLFYQNQFGALLGLAVNIIIYTTVTYMIIDEEYESDETSIPLYTSDGEEVHI